jgi:hypothetical protein
MYPADALSAAVFPVTSIETRSLCEYDVDEFGSLPVSVVSSVDAVPLSVNVISTLPTRVTVKIEAGLDARRVTAPIDPSESSR